MSKSRKKKGEAPVSVCGTCGKEFKQIWQRDHWSNFKDCPKCRVQNSPVEHVTRVIPYIPHEGRNGKGGQNLVHASKKPFKLIRAGASWGKDVCCVAEFCMKFVEMLMEEYRDKALLAPRVHGWILAPTLGLTDQNWRYFLRFFPKDWIVDMDLQEKKIYTVYDGLVEFKSTSNPNTLVSVGLDILLWTEIAQPEHQDKLEEAWANLVARLQRPGRGPGGKGGLFLGNSTPRGKGLFYQMHLMALEDPDNWDEFHFTAMDSPYTTKRAYENAKRNMPERLFRQIWLAEFPDDSGEIFANLEKICVLDPQEPKPGMVYKAAWDPARKEDFSAFGIRDSLGNMVYKTRWTGMPWTVQLDHVQALCRKYNNATVDLDKTGVGETLPEACAQRGLSVNAFHFTNELKAAMVSKLSLLCEQNTIKMINDDILKDELSSYRAEVLKSGMIRYSAPKHKHDDLVTMCLLLYHDFSDPVSVFPFYGRFLGAKRSGVA